MKIKHISKLFLLLGFSTYLCGCSHLFFSPSRYQYANPLNEGYMSQAITFKSKDGTQLTGLFFPDKSAHTIGTIVHFHGNGENMTSHYRYTAWLSNFGFNVFIFDYRGYGASGGHAFSIKKAVEDSEAAIQTAFELPGVEIDKIVLFGQSLGTAMAIAAAAKLDFHPAAMVLEGSFYSYKGVSRALLSKHWMTWPFIWLPTFAITTADTPKKYINEINCPKMFLHSVKDNIVSYDQGLKLYNHTRGEKAFFNVPGGHTDAFSMYVNRYGRDLLTFLYNILQDEDKAKEETKQVINAPKQTKPAVNEALEEPDDSKVKISTAPSATSIFR